MLAILGPIAPALGRRFSARADLPRLLAAIAAVALAISFLAIAACGGDADESPILEGHPTTIEVTSTAFAEGSDIPARFTCDGADISPPLQWTEVPQGTKSLALIVDDPDARGTWVHWVMYAIPNTAGRTIGGGTERRRDRSGRNTGEERLRSHRIRRALSARWESAPLLFQDLRFGRNPGP